MIGRSLISFTVVLLLLLVPAHAQPKSPIQAVWNHGLISLKFVQWVPEQGFRLPNSAPSNYDYEQFRADAARYAQEQLGFSEAQAIEWVSKLEQALRDQNVITAKQSRDQNLEQQIVKDAAENQAKRSEVATGREDPGTGVRVRDELQNDAKAEIARNAAERSGATEKINKATAAILNSLNPNAGEAPKNVCDLSGPINGPHQKDAKITTAQKRAIAEKIIAKAREMGVDPALALSVAYHESGGLNPNTRGLDGEIGLFQLMEGTAKQLGITDRRNIDENIRGGITYLRQQLDRFGNVRQALAAYNGGPGIIRGDGSYPNKQYPELVLAHYNSFRDKIARGELGNGQADQSALIGLLQNVKSSSNGGGCNQRLKDAVDDNTRSRATYGLIDNERLKAQNQVLQALVGRQLQELLLQSQLAHGLSTGKQINWQTTQDGDPARVPCPPDLASRENLICYSYSEDLPQSRLLAWLQTLQELARSMHLTAEITLQVINGQSYAIVTSSGTLPSLAPQPSALALNRMEPVAEGVAPSSRPPETIVAVNPSELEAALAASQAAATLK